MKRAILAILMSASAVLAHPGHSPIKEGDVVHAVTHADHAIPLAIALIAGGAVLGALLKFIRQPIALRMIGGACVGLIAAMITGAL